MTKHHRNSPSQAHRRQACPGSFPLEMEAGETLSTSADAQLGTVGHELLAHRLNQRDPEADAPDTLPPEIVEHVDEPSAWCAEYILSNAPDGATILTEGRVQLFDAFTVLTEGTYDALVVPQAVGDNTVTAKLYDAKFGNIETKTPDVDLQLLGYAGACFHGYEIDRVEATFLQPMVTRSPYHAIFETPDAAVKAYRQIRNETLQAEAVFKDSGRDSSEFAKFLHPSFLSCRYCRAFQERTCPALHKQTEEIMALDSAEVLKEEQWTEYYDKADLVIKKCKALKKQIKDAVQNRALTSLEPMVGFKECSRRGKQKPLSIDGILTVATDKLALSRDETLDAAFSVSIPQLRKLFLKYYYGTALGENGKKKTKKALRAEFEELIKPYVIRESGYTYLQRDHSTDIDADMQD